MDLHAEHVEQLPRLLRQRALFREAHQTIRLPDCGSERQARIEPEHLFDLIDHVDQRLA